MCTHELRVSLTSQIIITRVMSFEIDYEIDSTDWYAAWAKMSRFETPCSLA
jgi:hypothetical protein